MKIDAKKTKNEDLLDFISYELSKTDSIDQENLLDKLVNYIEDEYRSKDEIKKLLHTKIENFKQSIETGHESSGTLSLDSKHDLSNLMLGTNVLSNMKQLFNKLEKNKDLSDLKDGVFHFSKSHMGIA